MLQGNCEYKLQLLSPTPSRLARLITQLKWRLLEGGGQALYQIGVADSGTLIGLTRPDLERSLETLEIMAGEIGASVIVVREVEVRGGGGHSINVAANRRSRPPQHRGRHRHNRLHESPSTIETAWGPAVKDFVDIDGDGDDGHGAEIDLDTDVERFPGAVATGDSDPSPGVFSMDMETVTTNPSSAAFAVAINSVYKPRTPSKSHVPVLTLQYQNTARRDKKPMSPLYQKPHIKTPLLDNGDGLMTKGEAKAVTRRAARDRRREARQAQINNVNINSDDPTPNPPSASIFHNSLLTETLHTSSADPDPDPTADQELLESLAALATRDSVSTAINAKQEPPVLDLDELRWIVEVLVVRKLSLSEAFLDFEGFGARFP